MKLVDTQETVAISADDENADSVTDDLGMYDMLSVHIKSGINQFYDYFCTKMGKDIALYAFVSRVIALQSAFILSCINVCATLAMFY